MVTICYNQRAQAAVCACLINSTSLPLSLSWSSPFELVSANLELVSADLQVSADLLSCQGNWSTSLPWNTLKHHNMGHGLVDVGISENLMSSPGEVCVRRRSLRTEVQATVRATQLLEAHLTNGPRMAIGCHWAIHGHYFATHDMPWLIIHYSWPLGFDFSHVTTC